MRTTSSRLRPAYGLRRHRPRRPPSGRTILVLLHGNPTSSYLWRNVIPHLEGLGRCIAPTSSGWATPTSCPTPAPTGYTFDEHRRFLDAFLVGLGLTAAGRIVLVVHDWGSALGFDWARRHPDAVDGIAYMEAIVRPGHLGRLARRGPGDLPGVPQPEGRGPDPGAQLLRGEDPADVGAVAAVRRGDGRLPQTLPRPGEDRRPTLTWPRQIPVDGEPPEVVADVEAYGKWLGTDDSPPKLFVNADPGSILVGRQREFCRGWPNQTEVTVPGRTSSRRTRATPSAPPWPSSSGPSSERMTPVIAVALAVLLFGVPLVCWLAVRAARDMDARGEAGWLFGVLILCAFPVGLLAWLVARTRPPQPDS